jgi:hypothetical protein
MRCVIATSNCCGCGEDFTETVALNEFTLDDSRVELSNYIQNNRKLLSHGGRRTLPWAFTEHA